MLEESCSPGFRSPTVAYKVFNKLLLLKIVKRENKFRVKEMKECERDQEREKERGLFQRALIFSPNVIIHHSFALAVVTCDRQVSKEFRNPMVNTLGLTIVYFIEC